MCLCYKGHPYLGLNGARWFVPCYDDGGGVAAAAAANSSFRFLSLHTACVASSLALSSFSHARLCLVMLEICLFHAEPVHNNIIQYCVTYTASHCTLNSALLDQLHILLSLTLALSCIHFYIGFICKPHSIRK